MRILMFTATAFMLAAAAPSWAQTAAPADTAGQAAPAKTAEPGYDEAIITDCLAKNADGGSLCMGTASFKCMMAPGGIATAGMHDCFKKETAQWDGLLNDAYDELTAEPGARSDALQAVQRDWIAFVDSACAWEAGAYEGGTLAGTAGGACRMMRTATRALELRGYLQEGAER